MILASKTVKMPEHKRSQDEPRHSVHAFLPSTRKAEARGSLWVQGQPESQGVLGGQPERLDKLAVGRRAYTRKSQYFS